MKTLHFEVIIATPREKVWHIMLEAKTFQLWTAEFAEGSHFIGSWSKGDSIQFLTPDGDGMVAEIAENILHEHISIRHLGCVVRGRIDNDSRAAKQWTPAFENYTFTDHNGSTKLKVSMDVTIDFEEYMNAAWPKALRKLKEICEQ